MEYLSVADELRLTSAKAWIEKRHFNERTQLMGDVQQLAETVDSGISKLYGINGSFFGAMSDLSYELEERGITAQVKPDHPLNEEYSRVLARLINSSPLAPYPHGFTLSPEGLRTNLVIPITDEQSLIIEMGKNLTLRDEHYFSDNSYRSLKLTAPGDHYNYDTEKVSLFAQQTTSLGHTEKFTLTMFPDGKDGYAKQKKVQIKTNLTYPTTTHPFDPYMYKLVRRTVQGFTTAAAEYLPRIKIPSGQV